MCTPWVRILVIVTLSASTQGSFLDSKPLLECGGKVYNEETHTCCSDTLVEIASKYECCGGDVIDTSYYECDRGIVFDTKVPNLCGEELFNRHRHFCCNEVLHWKSDNEMCCGDEVIETKHYRCSFGLLGYYRSLKPKYNCWGSFYDPETQVCCSRYKLIPKDSEDLKC